MKHSQNIKENLDAVHEQILEDGETRFPRESYRRLMENGASHEEALELLGYDPKKQLMDLDPNPLL